MTPARPSRRIAAGLALALVGLGSAAPSNASSPGPAAAAASTIDVAVTGSDSAAGTAAAPLKTIQAAIDRARPGTTIRVHKGTYSQQLVIRSSGTATAPITVTAAGDGEVKVTSVQPKESCNNRIPTPNRTILIKGGNDNWVFSNLWIENGAYLNGTGGFTAYTWHAGLVKKAIWEPRRAVPGSSKNDPVAAKGVPAYLEKLLGAKMNQSERISFIGNKITGRGIHSTFSSYGVIKNNTITDIDCGTGPGVWLITFSQFWDVTGNDVSKIATSASSHFMQEGIRLGTASNYNHVASNKVHDLGDDGRGIATDVDASFNIFENNTATNVPIGFNDEMSGWGNIWRNNRVSKFTLMAFGFRMKDSVLKVPSMNSSTNMTTVTGNVAEQPIGSAKSVAIGAMMNSSFDNNTFAKVACGPYVRGYWVAQGNTWNGKAQPPPR